MKKYVLMLWVIMGIKATINAQGPARYAVIIAIGEYPEDTKWKNISSVNDVNILEPAFRKLGFDRISKLINEEATRENIKKTLSDLAAKVQKGDQVIIHVSSHGQQIWDDNGDEVDGFDEAIVAYGAPAFFSQDYQGEKHMRDEEFGALLDAIRARAGKSGDVVVFMDACHSGTGTRGDAVVRGGVPAMAPPGYVPGKMREDDGAMFEERAMGLGLENMAPLVYFSAARASELNYEYNGYGSLSVAIERAMSALHEGMTYRAFFAQILKEMSIIAPRQNPGVEGDIDRGLFGGNYVVQQKYYTLASFDGNWVKVEGGTLNGIYKDTEMALYPAGTVSTEGVQAVYKGKILSSDAIRSDLELNDQVKGNPNDYWAFVTHQTYGDRRVSLRTRDLKDKALRKALDETYADHPLITLSKDQADFSLRQTESGILLIDASTGDIFNAENDPEPFGLLPSESIAGIEETLKTYAQGKFMKELDMTHPSIKVELELIPVTIRNGRVLDTLKEAEVYRNGTLTLTEGQTMLIRVHNHSRTAVYFNLVDVQPDGVINLILPDPEENESAEEYKIPAQTSFTAPRYIEIFPPYGTEVFKLFASNEPIDFRPMHTGKGKPNGTRGTDSEVEKLFGSTYQIGTRGASAGARLSGTTKVTTISTSFKISAE